MLTVKEDEEQLRVLYITNYANMYGANKSLFTLMSILKEHYGVEPYLLISGKKGDIGKCCDEIGIKCFEYDFRIRTIASDTKNKQFRKITRYVMCYKEFYSIFYRFRKQGLTFDLIHSNSSIFDIGLFLSKKFNIPHVWHVREYLQGYDYDYDYVYGKKTIINKYMDSDVVIAISNSIESYIKDLNKGINVRKIHNGIVLPKAYRKKYCVGNIVRFCIVGAVQLHKNQMDVIKAADCLIKRGYREFEIYIVGDIGGDYYNQISKYLSDKEELLKRVIFTGYCDNVIEFLKDKDVGIMASDMEAFGRVTIEYMANYMPVIGTNTGGTVELIKDVGILYEPHDVEALAEAMRSYVENPEKLQYSCNAVRNRAEIYDADTNAKLVFETYRELI